MSEDINKENTENKNTTYNNKRTLIGVYSRFEGPRYFLSEKEYKIGDYVIVESDYGNVVGRVFNLKQSETFIKKDEYQTILDDANGQEIKSYNDYFSHNDTDKKLIQEEVLKLKLGMNLVNCYYTSDMSKILVTYTSDDKVDFRELLKVLKEKLKYKLELRQIGPRDKAKIKGGVGLCGLKLCCSTFLKSFDGISSSLLKNQYLPLNNTKLLGQCGKFMCCLKYEDDLYTELKKGFPLPNEEFTRNGKTFKVTALNLLSNKINLQIDNDRFLEVTSQEYQAIKNGSFNVDKETQIRFNAPTNKDITSDFSTFETSLNNNDVSNDIFSSDQESYNKEEDQHEKETNRRFVPFTKMNSNNNEDSNQNFNNSNSNNNNNRRNHHFNRNNNHHRFNNNNRK